MSCYAAGHKDWILCQAVNDAGTRLLTGGADKRVRLWDLEAGECLVEIVPARHNGSI